LINEALENIAEAYNGCECLAEMGEHPEWHSYEITNDDESYRVMQRFYELGGSRTNFHNLHNFVSERYNSLELC